ncbi:hypothetical protein [Thauera phenylacetica]
MTTPEPLLARARALQLHGVVSHWAECAQAPWIAPLIEWEEMSVITGFDVVMVTLRDGELPHERRSALLLEREGALHSGVFKAMPFGCGLRPQP